MEWVYLIFDFFLNNSLNLGSMQYKMIIITSQSGLMSVSMIKSSVTSHHTTGLQQKSKRDTICLLSLIDPLSLF